MRMRKKQLVERVGLQATLIQTNGVGDADHREADEGFTLVELLVVVVIMGVLATVSVLGVRGLTDRGQASACESDRRVMEVAVETWFADESLATSGTLTEAALVDAQLLRDESTLFDVQSDGTVVPVENGACDQA
jgi:prepilin-type N-terminal cleavage/methylation domain-containing protein